MTRSLAPPASYATKPASRDAPTVIRHLAKTLAVIGFEPTRTMCFVRANRFVLGAHLNGPSSDEITDPGHPGLRRDRCDFDAGEASWEACAEAMHRAPAVDSGWARP